MFREHTILPHAYPTHLMSLGRIFRMMYWSLLKDWRVFPHLVAVTVGWLTNLARLKLRNLGGHGSVAIGLVEHLGDIVAAEPISRLARRLHPAAQILWFARKPYATVPAGFAAVDAVVEVTCLTEWLLLRASRSGNPAWDLHINHRYCPRCQIPVAKTDSANTINPSNYYRYGNLLAVQCLSVGIPILTDGPELPVDDAAARAVAKLVLPLRLIVIHCASNEASRDWQRENWLTLLDQLLLEPDLAVAEVGTTAVVITRDQANRRNLCGMLSIQQTAEVMRCASLFIGIDSGPAHLANAVGVPGVILLSNYKGFGAYMPYSGGYASGERAEMVRSPGPMDTLTVAPVLAAALRRLHPNLV